jgi:hypothetical protein
MISTLLGYGSYLRKRYLVLLVPDKIGGNWGLHKSVSVLLSFLKMRLYGTKKTRGYFTLDVRNRIYLHRVAILNEIS